MSKLSKANRVLRKTANGNEPSPPSPEPTVEKPITRSLTESMGVNIDNTQRLKKKNERKQTERVERQRMLERKLKRKEQRNKSKADNKKAQQEHKDKMKKLKADARMKKKRIKSQR